MVKRVGKWTMIKIISVDEKRKQRGWQKGFEETRLLGLRRVVWEASLKSQHHGRNQPGEEPRKDPQIS